MCRRPKSVPNEPFLNEGLDDERAFRSKRFSFQSKRFSFWCLGGLLHIVVLGSSLGPICKLCYVFDMFFGIWLKGVPKAGLAPQEHGAAPNEFLCSPFMPAGSGSRPSSASSGAGEAECQWKRNASRKRKLPIQRQLGGGGSEMPAGSGSGAGWQDGLED